MLENLVVALDGSPCADRALQLALNLAARTGSKLAMCSVVDPSPVYGTLEPAVLVERTLDEIRNAATRAVNDALAKAEATGLHAQVSTPEGEPVYEIISYANRLKADGIVIGTHGRSGLSRLFIGSVAEGVMRHATVPVITVREEARVPELQAEAV